MIRLSSKSDRLTPGKVLIVLLGSVAVFGVLLYAPLLDLNEAQSTSSDMDGDATPGSGIEPIRSVDFGNFTYRWCIEREYETVTLSEGEAEYSASDPMDSALFSLQGVRYADLTQDGKLDALVIVHSNINPGTADTCSFVYAIDDNTARAIWSHHNGDREDRGLRNISLDGNKIIIEEFVRSEHENQTMRQAPERFVRLTYEWNGSSIERTRSDEWLPFEPAVVELNGKLDIETFFGPPNFGEEPDRDSEERHWILTLDKPINVRPGPGSDPLFSEPVENVRKVQLVMHEPHRELIDKRVLVTGTLFRGHTGHHFTEALLNVRSIRLSDADGDGRKGARPSAAFPRHPKY